VASRRATRGANRAWKSGVAAREYVLLFVDTAQFTFTAIDAVQVPPT